jgi:hypothetical protein
MTENPDRQTPPEDLCIDRRIIIKWTPNRYGMSKLVSSGLRLGPMAGNQVPDLTTGGEFLELLRKYYFC